MNQGYIDSIDSVIDKRAKIYYPVLETKKYSKLFLNDKKNNFSQEIDKIVVNSTRFPSKVYIQSIIDPILKYSSENGYYTKIKNHLDNEITLEELLDQYFGNIKDYLQLKQEEKEQ